MATLDYYPFFLSDVPELNGEWKTMDSVKENLVNRFIKIESNNTKVSKKDLINEYKKWEKDGEIGSKIESALNRKFDFVSKKITGYNFHEDVLSSLSGFSKKSSVNEAAAQSMRQELENRINNWIDILNLLSDGTVEKYVIESCLKNNEPLDVALSKYNGKTLQIGEDVDKKFVENVKKLQSLMSELSSIESSGRFPSDSSSNFENYKSGDSIPSIEKWSEKIGGCLAAIGGEAIYEVLVAETVNEILEKENDMINETDLAFEKTGGKVIKINSQDSHIGTETIYGGYQIKPDIAVVRKKGAVILQIKGSIKLYQGAKFFEEGRGSGEITYKTGLIELLKIANTLVPNTEKHFIGALTAVLLTRGKYNGGGYVGSKDILSYKKEWEDMKRQAAYLAFYRKFIGTNHLSDSGNIRNTVQVFIINNRPITVYQILNQISQEELKTNGKGLLTFSGSGWNWKFSRIIKGAYYNSNQGFKNKVSKFSNKKGARVGKNDERVLSGAKLRKAQAEDMLRILQQKKINMNLRPQYLGK